MMKNIHTTNLNQSEHTSSHLATTLNIQQPPAEERWVASGPPTTNVSSTKPLNFLNNFFYILFYYWGNFAIYRSAPTLSRGLVPSCHLSCQLTNSLTMKRSSRGVNQQHQLVKHKRERLKERKANETWQRAEKAGEEEEMKMCREERSEEERRADVREYIRHAFHLFFCFLRAELRE